MMRFFVAPLLSLGAIALGGCASTPDATPQPTAQVCASDPRVSAFKLGIESAGTGGALHVSIVSATPAWVVQGVNDWTLDVTDGSGAPRDGLTLTVKPFMPDHGHGSSTVPQVTTMGGGRYHVTGISLPMRGVWDVTVAASGALNDAVVFTFCVDGS
ncbi:hypothetical protein BH09MYX1_BH09MYX1_17180 [soil metagenome]